MVARSPTTDFPPFNSYFQDLQNSRDPSYGYNLNSDGTLNITTFDKLDSVLFTRYTTQLDDLPTVSRGTQTGSNRWGLDSNEANAARDSLIRLIRLKKVKDDPFMFPDTVNITQNDGSNKVVNLLRRWEESSEVRYGIISDFIRNNSRLRTEFDFGDDDGNRLVDLLWTDKMNVSIDAACGQYFPLAREHFGGSAHHHVFINAVH